MTTVIEGACAFFIDFNRLSYGGLNVENWEFQGVNCELNAVSWPPACVRTYKQSVTILLLVFQVDRPEAFLWFSFRNISQQKLKENQKKQNSFHVLIAKIPNSEAGVDCLLFGTDTARGHEPSLLYCNIWVSTFLHIFLNIMEGFSNIWCFKVKPHFDPSCNFSLAISLILFKIKIYIIYITSFAKINPELVFLSN